MKTTSLAVFLLLLLPVFSISCSIYFTGVGCPHCAKTDPFIFENVVRNKDLLVIEYEIYQTKGNGPIMYTYSQKYSKEWLGIPLVIFSENEYLLGDTSILKNMEKVLGSVGNNSCLLLSGKTPVYSLNFSQLPGSPKFWYKDRVLVKGKEDLSNELINKLLFSKDLGSVLKNVSYLPNNEKCVPYSGGKVCFDNSIKIKDWELYWNGKGVENKKGNYSEETPLANEAISQKLTFGKIVSLAAVDAVNPCALAVLTLMLLAITTYNPKDKKKVLLAGLAFTFAVYIIYLFYGLIIVKFFQVVSKLVLIKLWIYKALAIFAIILGFLNLKDALHYKPGGFLTEMPMSWRPKVKKIIASVTSPTGAFFVGAFVTIFLLPCTMGPYVIAGGILSAFELIKTLPWLLLYNAIFVSPMLAISFVVYLGYTTVEKVSGWRSENIRGLHAIAGAIMLTLGILMLFGVI